MNIIEQFLSNMTVEPFKNLLLLMTLPQDQIEVSLIFLGALVCLNDLLRTALMVEYTRSTFNHTIVAVLTMLPAFFIGFVLLYAGYTYPERAWFNLLIAVILYGAWYVGGALTRFSRHDTEGADVGWMAMGVLITFPCGLLAIMIF